MATEKIIINGRLNQFEGMTETTKIIYMIFASWLTPYSAYPVNKKILEMCEAVYVTSQDRGETPHVDGKATDISLWIKGKPTPLSAIIGNELSKNNLTVYISTYNYHLHISNNNKTFFGAEVLSLDNNRVPPKHHNDSYIKLHNPKISIKSIDEEIFNVLVLYQSFPSNWETDSVLNYFKKDKKDYDAYYKKMYPDGKTLFIDALKQSGEEAVQYMEKVKDVTGNVVKYIPIIIGGVAIYFIYKWFKK